MMMMMMTMRLLWLRAVEWSHLEQLWETVHAMTRFKVHLPPLPRQGQSLTIIRKKVCKVLPQAIRSKGWRWSPFP